MLSEDVLNKDLIYSLLLVLSGILMDDNGEITLALSCIMVIGCCSSCDTSYQQLLARRVGTFLSKWEVSRSKQSGGE